MGNVNSCVVAFRLRSRNVLADHVKAAQAPGEMGPSWTPDEPSCSGLEAPELLDLEPPGTNQHQPTELLGALIICCSQADAEALN